MIKRTCTPLLLLLSFIGFIMCVPTEVVDNNTNKDDQEQSDPDSIPESGVDPDTIPEPEPEPEPELDVETLLFEELIQQEEYASLSLNKQIEKAVDQIEEGGIIQFPAGEYKITSQLYIRKSVILQGVGTTPSIPQRSSTNGVKTEGEIKEIAGASDDIKTTFEVSSSLSNGIWICADNVTLRHLYIKGAEEDNGTQYKLTNLIRLGESNKTIANFKTENVHLAYARYLLSPRGSMISSINCQYTTFTKSYNRAFFANRLSAKSASIYIEEIGMEFYRCSFSVVDPNVGDTRAISLDAGNAEDPNILGFKGGEIRECYFHDIGFASSKCRDYKILDCEFYIDDLFDAPLHMEEFSREITVGGNLFICNNAEKQITHAMNQSVIENNTVIGNVAQGFLVAQYAEELTIRNNDLSRMGYTGNAISLWSYIGSRNITLSGNNYGSGQKVSIKATSEYSSTIKVNDTSSGYSSCTGYSYPFESETCYRIKHKTSGEYLYATAADGLVDLATIPDDPNAAVWIVKRVWPNLYNVVNKKYGSYLYIECGTEGLNVSVGTVSNYAAETKSFLASERKPVWDLSTQDVGGNIIGPGGCNVSCLGINNGSVKAIDEKTGRYSSSTNSAVTNTACIWVFETAN